MLKDLPGPEIVMEEEELPDHEHLPSQLDRIDNTDWDVLVCLDAMRWDVMDAMIEPEVEAVRTPSEGSTPDWVKKVWCRDGWDDVAYLSANPMVRATIESEDYEYSLDEYVKFKDISQLGGQIRPKVTLPDKVTELTTREDPPVVAHYCQPHTPFVGQLALNVSSGNVDMVEDGYPDRAPVGGVAKLVWDGKIDLDVFRQAYVANAHLALKWAKKLIHRFDTVAITADHGEGLGPDNFDHGGPMNNCNRVVPWVVFE